MSSGVFEYRGPAGKPGVRWRIRISLRMDVCVQPLSCKIVRATLGAQMPQTPPVRVGDHGAMWRRRWSRLGFLHVFPDLRLCLHFACDKLLEASGAEAAWNFCAPVVDYDGVRKEVAAALADKIVEVQGLVARLQKTQRAAEQALDKRAILSRVVAIACSFRPVAAGMRKLARPSAKQAMRALMHKAQAPEMRTPFEFVLHSRARADSLNLTCMQRPSRRRV